MPKYQHILYKKEGPIVTITLNRPDKLNALNDPLMHSLGDAFGEIENDKDIRVVILTGAGRAFSSGYDLSPRDEPLESVQDWREHATKAGRDVVMKMWDLRVPVVTAVQGYALGGGCDLVLASDISIAAENAKIGEPEIRGVSSPPTFIMPWVIGMKKAKELLLTGDMVGAEEALRLGMVNKVVPVSDLHDEVLSFAKKLANIPPIAMELNKKAINHSYETMGMKSAIAYGVEVFTLLLKTEEAADFGKKVAEMGLKKALEERDKLFEE